VLPRLLYGRNSGIGEERRTAGTLDTLIWRCSCEMEGFRVCTSDLASSRLLRDDTDTLLECSMRCRVLEDAIDDEDLDEVRERVVGQAMLEVVDLRFAFVAVCA